MKLSNPTRQLRSLVWTDIITGKTVRTVVLDSTKKTASDSMIYSWNSLGVKGLECAVTDMAVTVWRDTAKISIVKDAPVVKMTYSPASIAVNDTIHFHVTATRKYGKIVKVEWAMGNTGPFSLGMIMDSVSDTAVAAPGVPDSGWLCVVRVTDDDGNVAMDTAEIAVSMFASATDSAGFGGRAGFSSVVFDNKMWVIAGTPTWTNYSVLSDVWYSQDGSSWIRATSQASFGGRSGQTSLVFNNKIWVIGGSMGYGNPSLNDVWYSSDGSIWIQSTSAAQFSRRSSHSSVVFDNKMWVIGGAGYGGQGIVDTNYSDVWYSADGVTWVQTTANAGFSPRSGHSSIVFDNKMWVIAGADNGVWYSADGLSWTQATANAGFSSRTGQSSIVFDNKMWVIAGYEPQSGNYKSDVWYSTDGVTWIEAAANAGFPPRCGASVAFNNKMWVIAGSAAGPSLLDDVWYSGFSPQ